ncbi:hypothetical protein SAMN05446037_106011 [Anaerovirgula multivorans]|uniref:Uncharacterized protein n=1 Tax=Anaerovirgula multivorans TaxID=312168 RepID=A0A239L2N1_9FIRM|nr:hypothetical protein SAMN05446037_106011 [Anaerovirgula multivorans]
MCEQVKALDIHVGGIRKSAFKANQYSLRDGADTKHKGTVDCVKMIYCK